VNRDLAVEEEIKMENDVCALCNNDLSGIGFRYAKASVETHVDGLGKVMVPTRIMLPVGQCCYRFVVKAER
tara:strand:+ start:326 stop:538 length:213 start_codon:yes stop_codon:yes gene_type:complete